MIISKRQYKDVLNPLGIEPRFNVGDSVWHVDEDGVYEDKVISVLHDLCFEDIYGTMNVTSNIKYGLDRIGYVGNHHESLFLRKSDAERKYTELTGKPLQSQKDLALELAKVHIQQALDLGVSLNEMLKENVL